MRKLILTIPLLFVLLLMTASASAEPAESWGSELDSVIPDQ